MWVCFARRPRRVVCEHGTATGRRSSNLLMRAFAVAIVTLLAASMAAVSESSRAGASSDGISARIVLPATTVHSGAVLNGYVEVRNATGREVTVIGCMSPFVVALSNRSAKGEVGWLDCREEFVFPAGHSRYSVMVRADYGGCVGDPVPTSKAIVRCEPNGAVPDLPPGRYRARLYQRQRVAPDPPAVRVRVLEAAGKQAEYGAPDRQSFPLPSSGWAPASTSRLALVTSGTFHAAMTADGACAWLGDGATNYFWPEGYRVRFNPTELLDRDGQVVAKEYDQVSFAGGSGSVPRKSRCGGAGQESWLVQSDRLSLIER